MKKGLVLGSLTSLVTLLNLNFVSAAWKFSDVLNIWGDMDVFTYVLPFLLIFAVVYGILNKSNIFGANAKGVNIIIALALGLLSLVGGYVPEFFQQLAPNLGIGISVLLAAVILVGLFLGDQTNAKYINYGLITVAVIIFIFVIYSSFSQNYYSMGNVWFEYGSGFVTLLIIIAIIALIVFWGKAGSESIPVAH